MRHPLMPGDTPDYMIDAWLGCLHWAIGEKEIVDEFKKDTGILWTPSTNVFERAIDKACGADDDFVRQFILWANENVWGRLSDPDSEEE